jgi:hypothetical protein
MSEPKKEERDILDDDGLRRIETGVDPMTLLELIREEEEKESQMQQEDSKNITGLLIVAGILGLLIYFIASTGDWKPFPRPRPTAYPPPPPTQKDYPKPRPTETPLDFTQ